MSKLTITVNNTQIERFIVSMLNRLKDNPGIDLKKEGNDFVITQVSEGENPMLPGKSLTWKELTQDVATSEMEYEKGEYLNSDELRDDVKNW